MSATFWSVLGIEATRDVAVIKRAYAVRLKDCHPEDDPAGFQRLRGAYEQALRYAAPAKQPPGPLNIDPRKAPRPTMRPLFEEAALRPEPKPTEPKPPEPKALEPRPNEPKSRPPVAPPETPIDPAPTRLADILAQPESTPEPEVKPAEPAKTETEPNRLAEILAREPQAPEPRASEPETVESRRARPNLADILAQPEPTRPESEAPAKPARPNLADILAQPEAEPARAVEPSLRPPALDPQQVLRAQHDARGRTLWTLVAQGADEDTLRKAFAEFITSEAMDSVGIHGRTETWVADLIAGNTPRSDPLVGPAIQYFGWRADRLVRGANAGLRVLTRADDLTFLDGIRRPQSSLAVAWRALNAKPSRWRVCGNRIRPTLPTDIKRLLSLIQDERPGVMVSVNSEGLAWWRDYLSRPQLPAALLWTAAIITPLMSLAMANAIFGPQPLAPLFAVTGGCAIVAAALAIGLYGVARPRDRWLKQKKFTAPLWLQLGWAPGAAGLMLAATVAPPSPWVWPAIMFVSLWLLYWVAVTGDPDRRSDVGQPWKLAKLWNPIAMVLQIFIVLLLRPNLRFPWQTRAILNFVYLAVFWMQVAPVFPKDAWPQTAPALLTGMVVFTWGAGSLQNAWRHALKPPVRQALRWGLAALVAAAVAAVIAVHSYPAMMMRLAAGLATVAVFAHKVPDSELEPKAWLWRDVTMRYGWAAWIIVMAMVMGPRPPLYDIVVRAGLGLLTGPAIVAVVIIVAPALASLKKPKPRGA